MDHERNQRKFESVFSRKVRAGKRRTYFFDVRRTKGEDYYLTLTESTRKFNGEGYERHKIFLYKEDFNRFLENLQDVIDHIKTNLMPEYDYDEFARRHEEEDEEYLDMDDEMVRDSASFSENHSSQEKDAKELPSEEDMSW